MSENKNLVDELLPGEARTIHLVRKMDPELQGYIANVTVQNSFPEIKPKDWIGAKDHTLYDVKSFVRWAKKWADPEKATIYVDINGNSIVLVCDEKEEKGVLGKLDAINLNLDSSNEYSNWGDFVTIHEMSHKEFLLFLKLHKRDINEASKLIEAYSHIKTTIALERVYEEDDGKLIAVKLQSKTGGSGKEVERLPGEFEICIPILMQDKINGENVTLECEITINEPEKQGEGATFTVTCPYFIDAKQFKMIENAKQLEKELISESPDARWVVVNGLPTWG